MKSLLHRCFDLPIHPTSISGTPASMRSPSKPRSRQSNPWPAGLAFALLLTGASFMVAKSHLLWPPGLPVGLVVLAIAQMGVHLVFFLQIGTGPDNANNVIALAFGVLIVTLVISGSLWIMANLNANMLPASYLMEMQR